jgi:hypothetical protein
MRAVAVTLLVLLASALASCAGSQPAAVSSDELLTSLDLPAPAMFAPRGTSALTAALAGSDFETQGLPPSLVTAAGTQGRFQPEGGLGGSLAYALYAFELTDFSGPQTLTTVWQVPILADDLWVALGNRDQDRWDWYEVNPQGDLAVDVNAIGPYLDESDGLLAVVLAVGDATCNLSHLYFMESPPVINSVSPDGGASGSEVEFSADVDGLGPINYSWDFGGAATPNESSAPKPTVTFGAQGTYAANLTVANFFGPTDLPFVLEVTENYEPGTGELIAQFAADTGTTAAPVRVVVSSGQFTHSFKYLNGVAVTVEAGAEYAAHTFNVGAPGGAFNGIDGVWTYVDPSSFLLPDDSLFTEMPVDAEPGLVYIAFNVIPIGGNNTMQGGDLFNFEMQFSAPGTYHLGFLEFQDVKRTYYSDDMLNEYYWNNIANGNGIYTIVVSD